MRAQHKINWKAFASGNRNQAIDRIKAAIVESGGSLMNFKLFSDIGMSMIIEIECRSIKNLHTSISRAVTLAEDPTEVPEGLCYVLLYLSFIEGTGDLQIEVPDVPG